MNNAICDSGESPNTAEQDDHTIPEENYAYHMKKVELLSEI